MWQSSLRTLSNSNNLYQAKLRSTSAVERRPNSLDEAERVITFSDEALLMLHRIAATFSALAKAWNGWVPLPAIAAAQSPLPERRFGEHSPSDSQGAPDCIRSHVVREDDMEIDL
jgi:hypothetical protein